MWGARILFRCERPTGAFCLNILDGPLTVVLPKIAGLRLYSGWMRIWSAHPSLLDRRALIACWRESLLAQKVLRGLTRGYTNHPQLIRFRAHSQPVEAIGSYLHGLADEAQLRGYSFNRSLIAAERGKNLDSIPVTEGQLAYELSFLAHKVAGRDVDWEPILTERLAKFTQVGKPAVHPVFEVTPGEIEAWEKTKEF